MIQSRDEIDKIRHTFDVYFVLLYPNALGILY